MHCFDKDDSASTAQLAGTRQKFGESAKEFIKRWRALTVRCPEGLSQDTVVEMCKNNMSSKLRSKIFGFKVKTMSELMEVACNAEIMIEDRRREKFAA